MAYAAVSSLRHTIDCIRYYSKISTFPKILESVYEEVSEFGNIQGVVEEPERWRDEREKALDEEIKEAAYKVEDALDAHVSDQYNSQYKSLADGERLLELSLDSEEITQACNALLEMAKKAECSEDDQESTKSSTEEDDFISSTTDFSGNKSKMVGLHEDFNKIKDLLTKTYSDSDELQAVSLYGMAGIGKTFLAMEIFEDSLILKHFERVAFVSVGDKPQLEKVMLRILRQLNDDTMNSNIQSEEHIKKHLCTSLGGRRYLIVVDDTWDEELVIQLKQILPDDCNGSRILITTRLQFIADAVSSQRRVHKVRFMNNEESWDLLCAGVFGEKNLCPYLLEKAGKKIAEKCEGLPLLIVTIARLLSKAEKTLDYWNKVADQKEILIFTDAYDEILKVLYSSYNYLPPQAKACFLYMGVFPPNYKILSSKLINLWTAEGFIEEDYLGLTLGLTQDFDAETVLAGLTSSNVIIVHQVSSSTDKVKTCSLHSVFWHLCVREARKDWFFQAIGRYVDSRITEDTNSQRRVCIYKNILFSIKDVYDSLESISTTRSLLCTGASHQYPLPICLNLMLLRVLEALTIRFYQFPYEVLKLFHLTYLALTWTGELPVSISKLWNLKYLIIYRHLNIKFNGAPSYMPMEIWDMVKLKHLQVIGSDLPEPDPCSDACLENLLSLLNVSARSCTKRIFKRIPNLKRLGIQIEVAPDAVESLSCFDHISYLDYLESLKCVIVNPNPMFRVVAFPGPKNFPSSLMKLSLSGCGYPWKYMRAIASLPNLRVLKLRSYAFQGPEWKINEGEFMGLTTLLLEDTDLVHWIVDDTSTCLLSLEHLIIRHCYKLKEIPLAIGDCPDLHLIELEDCPSAVPSATKIQEQRSDMENEGAIEVYIQSSWVNAGARKLASASEGSQCRRCCHKIGKLRRDLLAASVKKHFLWFCP